MSLYTKFLKLLKPDEAEKYNVNVFNGNADLIDSALSRLDQKDKSQDDLLATKDSLNSHINNKNNPHEITKSKIGLSNVENTSDSEKPVSTAQREAINDIYAQANSYTDAKIAELINGAPETLDTLKEIADAIEENETIVDALNDAIGNKANKTDPANSLALKRINEGNADYKPGKRISEIKEFHSNCDNIPTKDFYHILTSQGVDVDDKYVTQLALGMTIDSLYYRNLDNDKWGKWHKIAYDETPSVKETKLVTNNGDLIVEGRKGNNYTNISDIFIKSNTYQEGMIIGISSNKMGYIIAQNFSIDCTKLTDDERILIQSFDSIKFRKLNDSNDFPILRPNVSDCEVGFTLSGKNGWIRSTTKMQIGSNSSENYFTYILPNEFKNDDNSSNNLRFVTAEWVTLTGINTRSDTLTN